MSGSRRLEGWRIDDMAKTLRVNEKAVDGWGASESRGGRLSFQVEKLLTVLVSKSHRGSKVEA